MIAPRLASRFRVLLLVLALSPPLSAVAQLLPPSSDPGRLEQRFEKPMTPESRPPIEFPAPEQAPPPDKAGAIHLTPAAILFDGGTVYSESELRALARPLLGREVSLLDLYTLRDTITAKYRNDGYVLSQAVIPAQRIVGGVVHLSLIEGRINKVIFQGEVTDRFGVLEDYAEKLKASQPLRGEVLERYVMLMDDLPGLVVHTVLQPSEGDAVGSNLVIVLESKRIGAAVSLDNRGTRSVGPYQIDNSVEFNDIGGQFEQTAIRAIITPQIEELRFFDLSHTEQIGFDGMTWVIGARRSLSEPGDKIRPLRVKSGSTTVRTGVMAPLIRSRAETLRLTVDVTYQNSRTNAMGSKLSDDRVRFASLGASYDISDSWQGSNLFQAAVHQGFDVFNATDNNKPGLSRPDGRINFKKLTVSAQRMQPLPENFGVLVAIDGQFSPDHLISSQQYGIGGKLYGRAFDSSEITGDRGVSGKVELQYTPEFDIPKVKYIQLFAYGDAGRAWNYDGGIVASPKSLVSVGGGLRFGLTDAVAGTVEFGKPFVRTPVETGDRSVRGFFSLSARY